MLTGKRRLQRCTFRGEREDTFLQPGKFCEVARGRPLPGKQHPEGGARGTAGNKQQKIEQGSVHDTASEPGGEWAARDWGTHVPGWRSL